MDTLSPLWFPVFFLVAVLYSMVGLGGGSAYVAFLTLAGLPYDRIPGTALGLNLLVTTLGFALHRKNLPSGSGRLVLLYGLAVTGAFLGSQIHLSARAFYLLLGLTLVGSALLNLFRIRRERHGEPRWVPVYPFAFLFGFLAALVGIGGGIFLAPILLLAGFSARESAGITSLYIALNSLVGFAGHALAGRVSLPLLGVLGGVVVMGAVVGATLGSRRLPERVVRTALILLVFAIGLRITWMGVRA